MNNDWKDNLASLLASQTLPEGDPVPEVKPQPSVLKLPKLTVSLDRKRAGKTATIISGFDPADPRAAEIAADLKRLLAVGGSCRGGEILVQGNHVDAVKKYLSTLK